MQLIPLEEVEKIWRLNHTPELMVVHPEWQYILLNNIYYIPTIDPIAIIDEMIKENKKIMKDKLKTNEEKFYSKYNLHFLQELKSRLTNIDTK